MAEKQLHAELEVYLRLIDYKRSIGTTQWTVLSVFVTASEAVFALALTTGPSMLSRRLLPALAVAVYWLGLALYRRYRNYNQQVSAYLVELEKVLPIGFQQHLNRTVHRRGLSTEQILAIAGLVYTMLGIACAVALT